MEYSMSDELITQIKSRFDHATNKKLLREKYQSKMTFAYAGGMFNAGPELLVTLSVCNETVVLEDLYGTPVKVNVSELATQTQHRWQEQMNAWLVENEDLSNKR
jgi:hypothetical protein|tara:strand:+ start:339 stop:650 length:312 start_codon:yes stop_codon:yes gene_type:complete